MYSVLRLPEKQANDTIQAKYKQQCQLSGANSHKVLLMLQLQLKFVWHQMFNTNLPTSQLFFLGLKDNLESSNLESNLVYCVLNTHYVTHHYPRPEWRPERITLVLHVINNKVKQD